jgi:hypothetical protein
MTEKSTGDRRLMVSGGISAFMDETVADAIILAYPFGVSVMSVAEMAHLTEKSRIPATALTDIHTAVADPKAVLRYVAVDQDIATNVAVIPCEDGPDLPAASSPRLRICMAYLY